jgi:dTDP-4-amino-4,6-dideoxygalactose transaminase
MTIRARPKYLTKITNDYETLLNNIKIIKDEFYFTSGRGALKFFLQIFFKYKKKKINIAMQSFNCAVVMDAALESNCNIHLYDINLKDFSISLSTLQELPENIDILLLTHYQGIPNIEYMKIIEYCKSHNIFVVEDIAQVYGSSIDNIKVGSLGNISISSYAFDKPISLLKGGSIDINWIDKELYSIFKKDYELLCTQTKDEAILDNKILFFLYKYSDVELYHKGFNQYKYNIPLIKVGVSGKLVFNLLKIFKFNIFTKIINKIFSIFSNKELIELKKLNQLNIKLVKYQKQNYKYDDENIIGLEVFLIKNEVKIEQFDNVNIHWNRYSLLDNNGEIKSIMENKQIEVGNYNWYLPLHKIYNDSNIFYKKDLKNSEYACKNILNIPVWRKYDK